MEIWKIWEIIVELGSIYSFTRVLVLHNKLATRPDLPEVAWSLAACGGLPFPPRHHCSRSHTRGYTLPVSGTHTQPGQERSGDVCGAMAWVCLIEPPRVRRTELSSACVRNGGRSTRYCHQEDWHDQCLHGVGSKCRVSL